MKAIALKNETVSFVSATTETSTLPIGAAVNLPPFQKMFSIGYDISAPPLFCTPDSGALGAEIGWFRALGLPVTLYNGIPHSLGKFTVKQKLWSVVLIDCDGYGGMHTVVSDLQMALDATFKLPVVFISRSEQPPVFWNPITNKLSAPLECSFSVNHLESILDAVLDPMIKVNKRYRVF